MYSRGLSALAFTADFPPAAPKFHQRTHRVRLRNLGTTDKKSSHKIKHKKIPRVHVIRKESFLNKANLIIEEVNKVLFDDKPAKEGVKDLMVREKRVEHLNLKWEN